MATETKRQQAIRSGVANAHQSVTDNDMTREDAMRLLSDFVQDGLSSAGIKNDIPTKADMRLARILASF